jgi:hypothetical protein
MLALTTTKAVASAAKRSWRHFTLRALLLAVLAASIFCGWVAYRVRQFHEQAAFIADLRERGFRIETEPVRNEFWRPLAGDDAVEVRMAILRSRGPGGEFFGPTFDDLDKIRGWTGILAIWMYGNCVTDETFAAVRNFRDLRTIMLFDTAISDSALEHLQELPHLTHLRIENTTADNEHAFGSFAPAAGQHIAGSQTLDALHLFGVPMDDKGLHSITTNIPGLKALSLVNCNLTDDCLAEFHRLQSLTKLCISNNANVTDDGLRHLYGLKSLNFLDATRTQVSQEGTEELRAHVPSLVRQQTWSGDFKPW